MAPRLSRWLTNGGANAPVPSGRRQPAE
jgi:hypothetical protein